MRDESTQNPSDQAPATQQQAQGREELEEVIPAGPAIPAPASMMKPAIGGSVFLGIAGAIIALAIGFVLVTAFDMHRSIMWISVIAGAAGGSVLGFVLGGVAGGSREEREDLDSTIKRNARTRPS